MTFSAGFTAHATGPIRARDRASTETHTARIAQRGSLASSIVATPSMRTPGSAKSASTRYPTCSGVDGHKALSIGRGTRRPYRRRRLLG